MPVIANGPNSKISLRASTLIYMLSIYPCFEEVQQFYLFLIFFSVWWHIFVSGLYSTSG